ncbi:hypothetical protein IQ266_24995 [filamentous cyanobacterium LEGE 11480]|uniref:Uncharacterized protein n=1 Tax=Romeriopsis navalis LEGE 11480 TaxID=2777977 RepID=A0A928VQP2_9CYAN|nr:hypothetical protein [Romeriopsis navalis]MBE9032998.1 hypothetical protein [Romeriopsis navalis LEGE 11480]
MRLFLSCGIVLHHACHLTEMLASVNPNEFELEQLHLAVNHFLELKRFQALIAEYVDGT